MARSKQVPTKRTTSSEFFNKQTAKWEDANGSPNGNGDAVGQPVKATTPSKAEAGIVQLVIAVSGIYASLWVEDEEALLVHCLID